VGGGLVAGHIHGRGADLPAEGDRLGGVVDRLAVLLRGRGQRAVDQVDLIAMLLAVHIVADQSAVAQAEDLARLLADGHTGGDFRGSVAGLELGGIGISLHSGAEVLRAHKVQVLDIVGVLRVGLSTGGALVDGGQAVPGHAGAILAVAPHGEDDAAVQTGFKETLADLVPYNSAGIAHRFFLLQKYRLNTSWFRLSDIKCRSWEHRGSLAISPGSPLSGLR